MSLRVRGKTTAGPEKVGDPTLDFQACGTWRGPKPSPCHSSCTTRAKVPPRFFPGIIDSTAVSRVRFCLARRISPRFDTIRRPDVRRPQARHV